jgi:signal transduction histidine kinase
MVEDDGVGFNVEAADSGNGMGNMRKRADALEGRFQLHSKPGEGTKVILNIPVA